MKKHSIALALISAIVSTGAIVSSAMSQTVTKDSDNNVSISGLTPSAFVKVSYGNLPLQKTFIPNSCGVITVKSTSKEPFIFFSYPGSSMIDWNELPVTGGKPLCKLGLPNPEIPWGTLGARSSSDPDQPRISYIRSTTSLLITSRNNFKERLVKANACGIVSLKNTTAWPSTGLGTFYYDDGNPSNDFTLAALISKPKPVCYKDRLYIPLT